MRSMLPKTLPQDSVLWGTHIGSTRSTLWQTPSDQTSGGLDAQLQIKSMTGGMNH